MKIADSLNVERKAARALEEFLGHVPNLKMDRIEREGRPGPLNAGIDLIIEGRFADNPIRLIVEVKNNGQPRVMREAAQQLKRHLRNANAHAIPIVMAPYLSRQARDACKDESVGYLDFMGNALIAFETIYIEREVPGRPEPERRALRSLYKPKSARILRRLLNEPRRSWRTAELAAATKVSIGLVSTVGSALRERGWAEQTDRGVFLAEPDELLDSWAENYEPPRGEEIRRYSVLHGSALSERLRGLAMDKQRVVLASFSAAEWLAPFVRHANSYFYADESGLAALDRLLDLREPPKGANIIIVVPDEDGVLDDAEQAADGLVTTSPVQTYLDLMHAGDRGREGAVHLRAQLLDWRS